MHAIEHGIQKEIGCNLAFTICPFQTWNGGPQSVGDILYSAFNTYESFAEHIIVFHRE